MIPDHTAAFLSALNDAGIPFQGPVIVDGRIHRFKGADDKEENSWYLMNQAGDGVLVGVFGCWKRQIKQTWCSRRRSDMSREDWNAAAETWREQEKKREREEKLAQEQTRQRCLAWFKTWKRAEGHFYLAMKGVQAHGPLYVSEYELYPEWLALPLQDIHGTIHSVEFIADDGTKKFLYQGRVAGCFYPVAQVDGGPILICEGYATGASLYEATGWTVICAMNCGNLLAVAKAFREEYPERTIVLCADDDCFTEGNPGLTKAEGTRKAVNGLLACPDFADEAEGNPTDFNDLHTQAGIAEVKRQVYAAFPRIAIDVGLMQLPPESDPTELIRSRYLCEGGGLLFNGPTGTGKSSWSLQQAACFTNGLPFFGIRPSKRLTIVIIQAENDEGDIAQVRNSVCTGLGLNEEQRRIFFTNCKVYTATEGIVGIRFCQEVVRPLLDLHAPNLLMIDPMLSFIGGNVKEQEIVGTFLRVYLNPELQSHKTGGELFHHTNKPLTGREKPNWVNGELAYLGTGSAEWANWARAILSLQSMGKAGYYKLHAAKRGARLGWKDANGVIMYERPVAWANDGGIYWREPSPEELASLEEQDVNWKKKADKVPLSFVNLLEDGALTLSDWVRQGESRFGHKQSTAYKWAECLERGGRVFLQKSDNKYTLLRPPSDPETD